MKFAVGERNVAIRYIYFALGCYMNMIIEQCTVQNAKLRTEFIVQLANKCIQALHTTAVNIE